MNYQNWYDRIETWEDAGDWDNMAGLPILPFLVAVLKASEEKFGPTPSNKYPLNHRWADYVHSALSSAIARSKLFSTYYWVDHRSSSWEGDSWDDVAPSWTEESMLDYLGYESRETVPTKYTPIRFWANWTKQTKEMLSCLQKIGKVYSLALPRSDWEYWNGEGATREASIADCSFLSSHDQPTSEMNIESTLFPVTHEVGGVWVPYYWLSSAWLNDSPEITMSVIPSYMGNPDVDWYVCPAMPRVSGGGVFSFDAQGTGMLGVDQAFLWSEGLPADTAFHIEVEGIKPPNWPPYQSYRQTIGCSVSDVLAVASPEFTF